MLAPLGEHQPHGNGDGLISPGGALAGGVIWFDDLNARFFFEREIKIGKRKCLLERIAGL